MRLSARTALIGILVLAACVYGASLQNGFVNLDDPLLVTENQHVLSPSLANVGYVFTHFDPELYIPFTFLTFQLESWTLGPAAWHFHLFSLLLHLLSVWLLFEIVKRFARSELIALLTALLFAIHPVNAEAVLWVSARKDLLSAAFFLASLLCFFLYKEKNARRWYWISLACFGLALMSKVTAVTLPLVFILLAGKPKDWKNWLRHIGPFLLLAAVFGIVAVAGKGFVEQKLQFTDFVFMAFRSVLFYLTLVVAPAGQSAVHAIQPHDVYSPLLPVGIGLSGLLSWVFWKSRRRLPLAFAGWVFFLVTLAPSFLHYTRGNELFMLGSERYMYLPSAGVFLIVASLWTELWSRTWITKPTRVILAVASALFVMVLCFLTVLRTFVFQDGVIFNVDILQKNPGDGRTWYNLGMALEAGKRPMEAEDAYRKALTMKPDLADADINLGLLFLKEGRTDEGMAMLRQATVARPEYFKGYYDLGVAYQHAGAFADAEAMYRKTIELFPDFPEVHKNLATVLGAEKKFAEAIREYETLAILDPSFRDELERLKAEAR